MCKFFSCISDGKGKVLYFDYEIRKKILSGELNYEFDSHSSIADYFKCNEDRMNKYEYNPLTKVFEIDQINNKRNDSDIVKKFCQKLDWKTIVPELKIQKIFYPFEDKNRYKVTKEEIKLLKEWASVRDSVWDSVWDSVGDSVGASVRDSVWASVRDSVGASVWAYCSTFFKIKYKYNFSSGIKLWKAGLVPSYDGKIWRLHGGRGAKVLWSGKIR